jgi:hypothetical protein
MATMTGKRRGVVSIFAANSRNWSARVDEAHDSTVKRFPVEFHYSECLIT